MRTSKQIFAEDREAKQHSKDAVMCIPGSKQKEMDEYYNYYYKKAEEIIRSVKGRYSIETAGIILSAMLAILKNE